MFSLYYEKIRDIETDEDFVKCITITIGIVPWFALPIKYKETEVDQRAWLPVSCSPRTHPWRTVPFKQIRGGNRLTSRKNQVSHTEESERCCCVVAKSRVINHKNNKNFIVSR